MSDESSKVESDRQLLSEAQAQGGGAVWKTYVKLSGPGWLQSAITLGGGSLAGALFLGTIGGTSLLGVQLVAIVTGVIMLSAISYVTLSTGERPFKSINEHINPALGWGWLVATGMANMIWSMPQFALCFASLEKNLAAPGSISGSTSSKLGVSAAILVAVSIAVILNSRRGLAAKVFDWFLKALVGMIVICFFGVTIYLSKEGKLDWGSIFAGFVPDLGAWFNPTGTVKELIGALPSTEAEFWSKKVVKTQQAVMIAAFATAVGINMTFLLPYSMLQRGWDKTFRGLARFDLSTGMAIPYVLVTTCVVIAASTAFNAKPGADEDFMGNDPEKFYESTTFQGMQGALLERIGSETKEFKVVDAEGKKRSLKYDELDESQRAEVAQLAVLPESEKLICSSLLKRDAFALSNALKPLLGPEVGRVVFGIGVFAMGFSTIIILMLINGFVFCEAAGKPQGGPLFVIGCLVAGVTGMMWPFFWDGASRVWLAILASSFGMMLLPIAYVTFFMMMNSKSLMGENKPQGKSMLIWNVLMGFSVACAIGAAGMTIWGKAEHPTVGPTVIGVGIVYVVLVVLGFVYMAKKKAA